MHVVWANEVADFTGGCEKYIYELVTRLKQKQIKSTLLYKVGSPKNPEFITIFDQAFPMVDLDMQLKELEPDVLYVHSVNDIKALEALVNYPCKTIRFFHDQRAFCLREHKYTAIGNKPCSKKIGLSCYSCLGFLKPVEKPWRVGFRTLRKHKTLLEINKRFDQIIVGSKYMEDQLLIHGFDPQKINTFLLFAYDITSRHAETSAIKVLPTVSLEKTKNAFPVDHESLLFVGQLVRGKGLDTLLDALAKCDKRVHLKICGTGRMEDDYKRQAERLGLQGRVTFLGNQTSENLTSLYRQSAAVVIPSRAPETFCLVGLEAILHGTPVIASNTGGMREWFNPGVNGLPFDANDQDMLAQAIDRFTSDQELQTQMRLTIARTDLQMFAPQEHVNRLHNLMTSMMVAA